MARCPSSTDSQPAKAVEPSAVAGHALVHVHLHVPNLAEAVDFYRAFLGVREVELKPGHAKFLAEWAPVNLAVSDLAVAGGGPVSHLGIQVFSREAVQERLQRVQTSGLPVRVEMDVDCCHANQDKFWVSAPGGVEWEVYHLNHDIEGSIVARAILACCAP